MILQPKSDLGFLAELMSEDEGLAKDDRDFVIRMIKLDPRDRSTGKATSAR